MEDIIVNKVAASGLITLDLSEYMPQTEIVEYDITQNLFQGLLLREKDFREFIKDHDWSLYSDKYVAILCSTDAIVPTWAYMLLATQLQPYCKQVFFGTKEEVTNELLRIAIKNIDIQQYTNQRLVIKGCADAVIPPAAYVAITELLRPVVKSIMYGEPCSTVPIYKQAKA